MSINNYNMWVRTYKIKQLKIVKAKAACMQENHMNIAFLFKCER